MTVHPCRRLLVVMVFLHLFPLKRNLIVSLSKNIKNTLFAVGDRSVIVRNYLDKSSRPKVVTLLHVLRLTRRAFVLHETSPTKTCSIHPSSLHHPSSSSSIHSEKKQEQEEVIAWSNLQPPCWETLDACVPSFKEPSCDIKTSSAECWWNEEMKRRTGAQDARPI